MKFVAFLSILIVATYQIFSGYFLVHHECADFSKISALHNLSVNQTIELNSTLDTPSGLLPCVETIVDSIHNSTIFGMSQRVKTFFQFSIPLLTYENQKQWLSTLNPNILKEGQLSNLRSVCPITEDKSAIVLLTNGISSNFQEWLLYHLFIGVSTIIIYDNTEPGSMIQASLRAAIRPFQDAGFVIHHPVDHTRYYVFNQMESYASALTTYGKDYSWIGFIDSDEYVALHKTKCLSSFLQEYKEFGGVVLQWNQYSSVGVAKHDNQKTTFEQYTHRNTEPGKHIKSFVQPKFVGEYETHNAIYVNDTIYAVNANKQPVRGPFNLQEDAATDPFEIAELRHIYMGDLQQALYEKLCGLGSRRVDKRIHRINMIDYMFTNIQDEDNKISLPLIHEDFVSFMQTA